VADSSSALGFPAFGDRKAARRDPRRRSVPCPTPAQSGKNRSSLRLEIAAEGKAYLPVGVAAVARRATAHRQNPPVALGVREIGADAECLFENEPGFRDKAQNGWISAASANDHRGATDAIVDPVSDCLSHVDTACGLSILAERAAEQEDRALNQRRIDELARVGYIGHSLENTSVAKYLTDDAIRS